MASRESLLTTAVDRARVASRRRSVLVTGAPRSGTTWLARQLANRSAVAMPGREPMNPRPGQFALAGTLDTWVQLEQPTEGQRRTLRRCFRGTEPLTFSRYGVRQIAALLPWTRIVVKDPFALLSVPAIVQCTGAVPVVVYRHPGAVLASYRRMGWTADTVEVRCLQGLPPLTEAPDDVTAMADFWTFLHQRVLAWLPTVTDAVLVSHAELVAGGTEAVEQVARVCGLPHARRSAQIGSPVGGGAVTERPAPGRLHDFHRRPDEVADGWKNRLNTAELQTMERTAAATLSELERHRLRLA